MKIETHSVSCSRSLTSRLVAFVAIAVVSALAAGNAWAKDSLKVEVANPTEAPLVVNNGQANGTIQLFYTVNANAFTVGKFATFDLNWVTVAGSGPATSYGSGLPFTLQQDQQGGNVDLVPAPATSMLTATGQSGKSVITVYITPDHAGLLSAEEGTDLVGNLKLDAGKVGTVTNIQVHIRLVHPTECVKVYNFVTDEDFSMGILSTTSLTVPKEGKKAGKVTSSQPGQFSDNVLIVNTCATPQSFDLGIGLDSSFSVSSNGSPVKTYTATGAFDIDNFEAMMTNGGAPNGQNLCLQNVTIPGNASFLATVHSKVNDNWPQASLPTDESFDFTATLYENTNAGCSGAVHSQASPNPTGTSLPFTIK